METSAVQENIAIWHERIQEASGKWGGAEICAVSKTVPAEIVNQAYGAGIRILGENRVQEMLGKMDALNPGFEMHVIGQMQTNKVRQIVGKVSWIQSLDRLELAREISRRCTAAGVTMNVLVEVNIAAEPQKGGVPPEGLLDLLRQSSQMPGIAIRGLMAVMPLAEDPETVRPYFRKMRGWFDRIRDMDMENVRMDVLSMGMSGDCLVAAQEGATMVRLGRAIFGPRTQK